MIDRPYSLPSGLSSWKVTQALGWNQDDTRSRSFSYVFFPFFWEQGLTDQLSLVWFPLPLEFRMQVLRNKNYRLGIGANVFSNIIFQFEGFNWTPFIDVDQRFYLDSSLALDWNTHFQFEIRRSTPAFNFAAVNWFGPLVQISDSLHLSGQLGFLFEYGNLNSLYIGKAPNNPGTGPFWRFPLRLGAGHTLSKQWQVNLFWYPTFLGYGESLGYWNQAFFIDLIHFF